MDPFNFFVLFFLGVSVLTFVALMFGHAAQEDYDEHPLFYGTQPPPKPEPNGYWQGNPSNLREKAQWVPLPIKIGPPPTKAIVPMPVVARNGFGESARQFGGVSFTPRTRSKSNALWLVAGAAAVTICLLKRDKKKC